MGSSVPADASPSHSGVSEEGSVHGCWYLDLGEEMNTPIGLTVEQHKPLSCFSFR